MLKLLKAWKGAVEINGVKYNSIQDALNASISFSNDCSIKLLQSQQSAIQRNLSENRAIVESDNKEYIITVKKYMTCKATPSFDFMARWNGDKPMPFRTMIGTVEKETKGMVYMNLHADIIAEQVCTCMKCGRPLTNPVSQYFGVGPECGGHNYVNPFNSEEELKAAVSAYRKQLRNIKWSGWIIKSAITERKELKNGKM